VLSPPVDLERKPLRFQDITSEDFIHWIDSMQSAAGKTIQFQRIHSHRSGLFNCFRDFKELVPRSIEDGLHAYFTALRQINDGHSGHEEEEVELSVERTGKALLLFSDYQFVCKRLLQSGKADHIFAHCMLVLSWNLMCRNTSTAEILLSQMGMSDGILP
jgi:hypothetical protein